MIFNIDYITALTPSILINALHSGSSESDSEFCALFIVKAPDEISITSQPGINFTAFGFGVLSTETYTSLSLLNRLVNELLNAVWFIVLQHSTAKLNLRTGE
jgi:hypothetical protein